MEQRFNSHLLVFCAYGQAATSAERAFVSGAQLWHFFLVSPLLPVFQLRHLHLGREDTVHFVGVLDHGVAQLLLLKNEPLVFKRFLILNFFFQEVIYPLNKSGRLSSVKIAKGLDKVLVERSFT